MNPGFTDLLALDLRLPGSIMAKLAESYPRGSVPGVILSTSNPSNDPKNHRL